MLRCKSIPPNFLRKDGAWRTNDVEWENDDDQPGPERLGRANSATVARTENQNSTAPNLDLASLVLQP
jgi:hypothetical protein